MPCVSVVHLLLGALNSVIDTTPYFAWGVMAPEKDCVTLLPQKNLPIANRDQYTSDSGIRSPWELGASLCPLGVSPGLSRCENSNWTNNGSCDQLCDLRPCLVMII